MCSWVVHVGATAEQRRHARLVCSSSQIKLSGVFRGLAPGPLYIRKFLGVLLLINWSNLLVNFREYILKIALTRSIFQPKMHQITFGGRAYSSPQTP